jgi:peroxiredoxin family protein
MAKKLALIASKGTLDWAYPPFILASTAAALDYEVSIFFTFYGLTLLKKDISDLKVTPLGNPAMPMPIAMPNLIQALPGIESMATMLMKQKIANKGVASIEELREICLESGVKMIACQMTMDLFGFKREEFIEGIEIGGAATFFEFAGEADVSLFI